MTYRWTPTDAADATQWSRVKAKAATLERLRGTIDDVFLQSLGQTFGEAARLGAVDALLQFAADTVAGEIGKGPDVAMRLAEAARRGMREEWAKIVLET